MGNEITQSHFPVFPYPKTPDIRLPLTTNGFEPSIQVDFCIKPMNNPVESDHIRASVCGIILAGGKAKRMGRINKALLKVGGRSIIERVVDELSAVFSEVIIITNHPADFDFLSLPMFKDLWPGGSSLGGIYTGLKVSRSNYALFVACDMPFLKRDIVRYLASKVGNNDIIIPKIDDYFEPLHAIYSRNCLPHIEDLLKKSDFRILNLFNKVRVLEVPGKDLQRFDKNLRFIMNVNRPEDLEKSELIAESADPD